MSVRNLYGHLILAAQRSSNAREAKKDVWINFMTDDNHVFGSLRSNQNARKNLKRKYVLKQNVFC